MECNLAEDLTLGLRQNQIVPRGGGFDPLGEVVEPWPRLCAARCPQPGAEGLFVLPYLTGERCPHPDPYARGGWIGITARTLRRDMIRALMEGVTYGMRDAIEIMQEMNIPISEVRASGGGARSPYWPVVRSIRSVASSCTTAGRAGIRRWRSQNPCS